MSKKSRKQVRRRQRESTSRRSATARPRRTNTKAEATYLIRESKPGEQRIELPHYEVDGLQCPELLISGPEVKEYADLLTMRMDFDHVVAACEAGAAIARANAIESQDRAVAMRATWESAVIAYGRAFVRGVSAVKGGGGRTHFPESVLDRLTPEQRDVHERTFTLRNKHVGHRVNDWTQVIVTGVLRPDIEGKRGVLQLGGKVLTVIGGAEAADALRVVAVILRDGLSERISALEKEFESQLRARSLDELYAVARVEAEQSAQMLEMERQRQASASAAREEEGGMPLR